MKVELRNKLFDFCEKENLIRKGDRIVVGVSGGMDSVCLLQILYHMKESREISLYVLHVHHMLRGEEADRDAQMVKEMADRLGLPFCLVKKQVKEMAAEFGLSVEEAGRKARYEALEAYRNEVQADKIAVAHHADDQAETVLFHLFRGTGPRGLGGIPAKRGNIIRPLLCLSRQEIEDYVTEQNLTYTVDRTNLIPEYTRNKIRLQLIPYVKKEINEQAVQHIVEAAEKNRQWSRYIEREGKKAGEQLIKKQEGAYCLPLEGFRQTDPVIQDEVLRQVFAEFSPGAKDISQVHYAQAKALFYKQAGCRFDFPGGFFAVRDYAGVCFQKTETKEEKDFFSLACKIPSSHIVNGNGEIFRLTFHVENRSDLPVKIPQKDYTKWFDYDKIKSGLVLRNPRTGDYFILNDNGEKKKLSRYYMDKKIPGRQRQHQLVLAEGHHVVWALPGRISEAYKVSAQTKRVLVVTKERDLQ